MIYMCIPKWHTLTACEKTNEYSRLQLMLSKLRNANGQPPMPEEEETRVITVRLPSCVHQALKDEAHARATSMNQLCISKLLQRMDAEPRPANGKLTQPKQPEISPL